MLFQVMQQFMFISKNMRVYLTMQPQRNLIDLHSSSPGISVLDNKTIQIFIIAVLSEIQHINPFRYHQWINVLFCIWYFVSTEKMLCFFEQVQFLLVDTFLAILLIINHYNLFIGKN